MDGMSVEAICKDIASFHGWRNFVDSSAEAYIYIAQQAIDREMHMTGVVAYLEYLDG